MRTGCSPPATATTCPTLEQVLLVAWDQRVERALKLALETTSRQ